MGRKIKIKTRKIGRKISKRLLKLKDQEKLARAFEKEAEVKLKQRKIKEKIKGLKAGRPTILKTIGRGLVRGVKFAEKSRKKIGKLSPPPRELLRTPKRKKARGDDIMDLVRKL